MLCLYELILFVDLNQKIGYSIFFAASRTGIYGKEMATKNLLLRCIAFFDRIATGKSGWVYEIL